MEHQSSSRSTSRRRHIFYRSNMGVSGWTHNNSERYAIIATALLLLLLLPVDFLSSSEAFSILPSSQILRCITYRAGSTSSQHMLPPDLGSSILLSVEVFDGSSIVDPVVVSGAFWGALQRQFVSVILGQVFAAIVFTVLASFFASQLSSLREFLVTKFLSGSSSSRKNDFIRADSPEYRQATTSPDIGKLSICLLIDFIGSSSELLPILGEFTDVITAPIAAAVLQNLFGGSKAVFFFEFAEEILPFTDIIPFATLCWVVDTYFPDSDIAGIFQLGKFRASGDIVDRDVIDTKTESIDSSDERKVR